MAFPVIIFATMKFKAQKMKWNKMMARFRGRGNKATEEVVATLLRRHGISGWRRHVRLPLAEFQQRRGNDRNLPKAPAFCQPDFVFRKLRVALLVNGCFWHGCPFHCRMPQSNRRYWFQ